MKCLFSVTIFIRLEFREDFYMLIFFSKTLIVNILLA